METEKLALRTFSLQGARVLPSSLRFFSHRIGFFAIFAFVPSSLSAGATPTYDSNYLPSVKVETAAPVSPSGAATYYGAGTTHSNGVGLTARPPEIVELARALKSDPDLIYEYVRNNIRVNFSYGLQKGALGALIDRSGTAFDQANLMVELLRQSGISASYKLGTVTLTGQQFYDWSGIQDAAAACKFLAAGSVPQAINGSTDTSCAYSGDVSTITLGHVWVEATIGGQAYLFDPAYKTHDHVAALSLNTIMGFTPGQPLSQATGTGYQTGTQATGGGNVAWFKQLQKVTSLNTYATTLLNWLRTNKPDATIDDVLGAEIIQTVTVPSGGWRQTAFAYTAQATATWSGDIPDQYRTTLAVAAKVNPTDPALILDHTFFVDEIYGRRMRLDTNFNYANQTVLNDANGFVVKLTVDGVQQGASWATTLTGTAFKRQFALWLTANHPYAASANGGAAGSYADRTVYKPVFILAPVTILHGWGDVSPRLAQQWGSEQAEDTVLPIKGYAYVCSNTSCGVEGQPPRKQPAGEYTRDRMGATWLAQFSRMFDLQSRVAASRGQQHNFLGVLYSNVWSEVIHGSRTDLCNNSCVWGINDEQSVLDVESSFSLTSKSNDAATRRAALYAVAAAGSFLEGNVVTEFLDVQRTASVSSRFAWANSPYGPFENVHNTQGGSSQSQVPPQNDGLARRFYKFTAANRNGISSLVEYQGEARNWSTGQYQAITDWASYTTALTIALQRYADGGFTVIASAESYGGPGALLQHIRFGNGNCPPLDFDCQESTNETYREQTKERGGAFVAFRTDGNGDPTEISHVVNGRQGIQKGGGAGATASDLSAFQQDPLTNTLRSRFNDRSSAFGVDPRSGHFTFQTPALISGGSGAFPLKISTNLVYADPALNREVSFGPTTAVSPFQGFTHSWDIRLAFTSDAMEAMGATSALPAAPFIAAIVTAQDLYRSAATNDAVYAAAPIAYTLYETVAGATAYQPALHHNVVVVSNAGNGRRFLRLVDGSYTAPKGDASTLTQTNEVQSVVRTCNNRPTDVAVWHPGSNVTFKLKGPQGDEQNFNYWEYQWRQCSYSSGFQIVDWTFPHNQKITFGTSAMGIVTTVTPKVAGTSTRTFQFTTNVPDAQTLTGTTGNYSDGNGNAATMSNTASAQTITLADGGIWKFSYRAPVARSDTQRPVPLPTLEKIFEPASQSVAALEYDYDSTGSIYQVKDAVTLQQPSANRAPTQFLNADGTRSERIDALGNGYVVYYDRFGRGVRHIDEFGRTVLTAYDGFNRVSSRTYPEGDQELFQYDSRSNVTRLTRKAKPNAGLGDIIVEATYDSTWNKPLTVSAPRLQSETPRTTTMTYYASGAGAGLIKDVLRPAIGGVQPKFTFTYSTGGMLTQETAPIGTNQTTKITTNHTYDTKGNRTKTVVDDITGQLKLTTQWQYAITGDVTRVMDPRGYLTLMTYDDMHRPTIAYRSSNAVTAIGNNVTGYMSAARTTYDLNGRPTIVEAASTITGTTVSGWMTRSTTTYTPTGKVSSVADAAGDLTSTSYDALDRVDIVTDPVNRKAKMTYDAASQAYQVIRAYGSALQQNYATYSYSLNGRVETVTDARGRVTKNVYDGFDRLVRLLFPDATAGNDTDNPYELYAYDAGGRRRAMVNRAGQTLVYDYNDLDQPISRTGPSLATRTYTYDLGGRRTQVKDMNGASVIAQTDFTYDTAGRETRERRNDWNQNVDFVYDANSNVTGLKWPDAFTVTYTFDPLNRITQIASGSTVYRTYSYDRFSRRTQQTASTSTGQVVSTYTYENDDDLAQITYNYPGATADLTLAYSYSPTGQLINSYTSESLNRHVVFGSNGTQTYTDANPLNQYPSLTPIGGSLTSISYDANGNLTSDGVNTFGYDAENRFLSVSGGATATYAYDALDRRMTKTTGGSTTRYLHAGSDEVAEYSSSGTLLRRFVPGPGTDTRAVWIESASTSPPATALSYPHTDRLGSVLSVTSNTGAVTARYEYNAWGGSNSSTAGYPFRYTGQRLDPETGLMFYKARIYSMALGRFLQTDPIGTRDDLNLYAYTGNDPVNRSDPSGTEGEEWGYAAWGFWNPDATPEDHKAAQYLMQQQARGAAFGFVSLAMFTPLAIEAAPLFEGGLGSFLTNAMANPVNTHNTTVMLMEIAFGEGAIGASMQLPHGSGPAPGFLEVSDAYASSAAVRSFGSPVPTDFVFDTVTERFVMGSSAFGHDGILAAAGIPASSSIVGGRIFRENGTLTTDEWSGHYGLNWTPENRAQFEGFMSNSGVDITHRTWP